MAAAWTPETWRSRPISQVPDYPDKAKLELVEKRLQGFPPLVFAGEARKLKRKLGRVVEGKGFLLQGETARKASLSTPPTIFAISFVSSCRWR